MSPALVVGYAAAVGVLVDLDHFLIARLNTGSWRAVRHGLADPRILFFDQTAIFEDGEVGSLHRLGSHLAITVVLVGGLLVVRPYLALVTVVVLVGHMVCDVLWDYTHVFGPPRARQRTDGE
jgi:hypothetical protein